VIRILSDENVHADIVSGLRQEGFDLVTAVDLGLAGRKDIEILDYAENHNLLILTGDKTSAVLSSSGICGEEAGYCCFATKFSMSKTS